VTAGVSYYLEISASVEIGALIRRKPCPQQPHSLGLSVINAPNGRIKRASYTSGRARVPPGPVQQHGEYLAADQPRKEQRFFGRRVKGFDYSGISLLHADRCCKTSMCQFLETILGQSELLSIARIESVSAISGVVHYNLHSHWALLLSNLDMPSNFHAGGKERLRQRCRPTRDEPLGSKSWCLLLEPRGANCSNREDTTMSF
jgi:hypothetical protein